MIYAVIVIYNKKCEDSKTFKSLKIKNNEFKIIIFDNSIYDYGNKKFCEKEGYIYFGFCKNFGLSYAYNYVVTHIKTYSEDYFIMFDDDTTLTTEYINEVYKKINNAEKFEILLPIVKAGKLILSPSNIKFRCVSRTVKNINNLNLKHLTAINSGMVIQAAVFKKVQYNEALFLDCVDHEFMKKIYELGIKVDLLESEIYQDYSRNEKIELDKALLRYKIYKKDFKIYCRECNNIMYFYISIIKLTLKYTIQYKTFKFFKI